MDSQNQYSFYLPELSEYEMNLLRKHAVNSAVEFVEMKTSQLCKLLSKPADRIWMLKEELLYQNLTVTTLLDQYERSKSIGKYGTGIEELDKLLGNINQPFRPGRIWEVCGPVGVGKTELLYSLAIHFVSNSTCNRQLLFIDTKRDFSSSRINKLLSERHLEQTVHANAMQAIKVIPALHENCIISILETLYAQVEAKKENVMQIQLVLIDSLPACFMSSVSEDEHAMKNSLLTRLASIMRKLSECYQVAFIVGNLSISAQDESCLASFEDSESNSDSDSSEDSQAEGIEEPTDHPMLGEYWSTVSTLRLAVELPPNSNFDDDGIRLLKVLQNSYGAFGDTCLVRITDAGII